MTGLVLQFGTSRFLQAHADLFLHEAAEAGQDVPPIAIIQTSGAAERAGRVDAFNAPEGFPVIIRGLENNVPVERTIQVKSVKQGLSVLRDWVQIVALFSTQATYIVSNTGDAGYELHADEADGSWDDQLLGANVPAPSFPGKLAQLLYARYLSNGGVLTILPCELISNNGAILREKVSYMAHRGGADEGFFVWLDANVIFANTLVDRIVSEPLEPVGAVAEPYALWAIARQPGLSVPCTHPAIVLADDLEPFERLKLHILNLGHTVLADIWLTQKRPQDETVRAILADPPIRAQLEAIYRDEVLPGFAAHGMEAEARAYIEVTLSRFLNPFLNHRIADIATNHATKIERRIGAFLTWAGTPAPVLTAIAKGGTRPSRLANIFI